MGTRNLEISIAGIRVEPETIRLRDLYEILHSFEAAISEISSEQTDFHLVAIGKGNSADCTISIPDSSYNAAVRCAAAIASRDLSAIPERARDSLVDLKSKAKARAWTFTLSGANGLPTAEISPETEFTADSIVAGKTSIAAKLIRIGGTPKPTAQLALVSGQKLTASIASEDLALALSPLLYRTISLEGEAKWSASDWNIVDFKITGIGSYDNSVSISAVLGELKTIGGDFWDDIDPDEYISTQRQEG